MTFDGPLRPERSRDPWQHGHAARRLRHPGFGCSCKPGADRRRRGVVPLRGGKTRLELGARIAACHVVGDGRSALVGEARPGSTARALGPGLFWMGDCLPRMMCLGTLTGGGNCLWRRSEGIFGESGGLWCEWRWLLSFWDAVEMSLGRASRSLSLPLLLKCHRSPRRSPSRRPSWPSWPSSWTRRDPFSEARLQLSSPSKTWSTPHPPTPPPAFSTAATSSKLLQYRHRDHARRQLGSRRWPCQSRHPY
jgi:hypothetical protein